ncbi:MAG: hypothetical protein K2F69_05315 [Bacteroidaceae bacterium]|nr:hypothetical protein [Bacteroidaceae bacterium]MDE6159496.1 hypothetical protein [Bacteroidaceae bacterium]
MTFFKDTQDTLTHLLTEVRHNADLQKQVVQRDVANGIGSLLSALSIGAAILLLANTFLFFACMALAHILGESLGSMAAGYAIMGGIVMMFLGIVYAYRDKWFKRPIMNIVQNTIGKTASNATTEELRQQLSESRQRIGEQMQELRESYEAPTNHFEKMTRMATLGFKLYEGYRLGQGLIKSIGTVFGSKKKKSRR